MKHKKIVQQRDHIILPKATLMRFMDNTSQKIYYLDLNEIAIKHIFPKSYHASPNYYNPEYDAIVKKYETAMGKLHKKILSAIDNNADIAMCADTLKKQIIEFATIEFHRSVIANDTMLEKYRNQQQTENDEIDSILFRTGRMTSARIEYSVNYRQKAESKESFRYYAQNILGIENQAIETTYSKFYPQILYIPEGSGYQFLLPPLHFVGNDQFLCFILSPNITLALYPDLKNDSLISKVDSERAEIINLRILECASFFDPNFKEIVGEKAQLEKMKKQIEKIRSITTHGENKIVINDNKDFRLTNMNSVWEFVIILCLLFGVSKSTIKVQMKKQNFDTKFFLATKMRYWNYSKNIHLT